MRPITTLILSKFVHHQISLADLSEYVNDVDWDDSEISQDERSLMLGIEGRIVGSAENYNSQLSLIQFIATSTDIFWLVNEPNVDEPTVIVSSGSSIQENGNPQFTVVLEPARAQ